MSGWISYSGGMPSSELNQFGLRLNELLKDLCNTVVEEYAFTGYMTHLFLATSSQGRGGIYHSYMPPQPTLQAIPHPTNPGGKIQAFVLECKLALREPSERGCRAFEEGLANIRLAPGDQWFHTHTSSYDRVHPSTSTYTFRFQFGPIYVFRIVWNTDSYPPQNITKLPYPPNICFLWSTTIPLIIGDLWHKLPPEEVTFFRGVLKESTSKGKGRV